MRPPLKSIVTNNPLDRVEGDLTDWRSEPSGPFKWILQLVVYIQRTLRLSTQLIDIIVLLYQIYLLVAYDGQDGSTSS